MKGGFMMEKDIPSVITATELKSNLGKYLDYVSGDNEIVITKNGKKAIRMTPYITDVERYFTVREKALDYQYGGKKVSYEEFMEIYEKSDLRMEYINGEIVLLSSPSTFHQDISGNLYMLLRTYLNGKPCKVFYSPFDVHFFKKGFKDPDVMQPDLLIACDLEQTVNEKGRYMGTPTLVVEVLSPSTRSKDMVDKLNTYMLSGVKEFWVVEPVEKTVMVYGFKDLEVDQLIVYRYDEVLRSYWFEGLEFSTKEVFKE
jgi:prevent-host-death family protein